MNKNCCQHADKIIDYLLGYLSERDKEFFEQHIESCQICQREFQVELAIKNELSEKLRPGFIENRIKAHLQLRQAQNMRSFWLHAFQMAVYGVTAAIAGFILIPLVLKFMPSTVANLNQYTHETTELLGHLAPTNAFFVISGFCYIAVFIFSMYSLAKIRR